MSGGMEIIVCAGFLWFWLSPKSVGKWLADMQAGYRKQNGRRQRGEIE